MGKGSSATTQRVVQEIPEYARPYFERNVARAEAVTNQPYTPYGGQRIAGFTPDILGSHQMVRDIAQRGTPGTDAGLGIMGALPGQAQALGERPRSTFEGFGGIEAFRFDPARQFTGEEVSRYMSPYMDAVVARQQQDAARQFEMQQGARGARAVGSGAFGGSRQAVQEALAEEALMRQQGDIFAMGQQRAFEQAAQQFGTDRAAQMTVAQQQAAELGRAQALGAQDVARVQQATANEAMQRDRFGLETLGFQADVAQQMARLEEQARAGDIQAAQMLERIGMQQMTQRQAGLDLAYEDFLRQEQYPMQQTAFMADLLRGLPIAPGYVQETSRPTNPLQELLGLGISGVGLYNAMRT